MLKHRHYAQGDTRDEVRLIYCDGKRAEARVRNGWWTCQRCGRAVWRVTTALVEEDQQEMIP